MELGFLCEWKAGDANTGPYDDFMNSVLSDRDFIALCIWCLQRVLILCSVLPSLSSGASSILFTPTSSPAREMFLLELDCTSSQEQTSYLCYRDCVLLNNVVSLLSHTTVRR